MAEQGAHVTSATAGSAKPSIFEVLAQESLMSSVRPALRHAVRVLGETQPAHFRWLYRFYEEAYTVLDLVLQNYFLKKYGGSFSENFYGLKRLPVDGDSDASRHLSSSCHRRSLITLVLLPYIKQRLDQLYEEVGSAGVGQPQSQTGMPSLYTLFKAVYPYLHSAWEGTQLCYQLAYVLGNVRSHSPFLHLSGVSLVALSLEELQDNNRTSQDTVRQGGIKCLLRRLLNVLAVTLSTGLSVGVFFLQFLDWWYASDKNTTSLTALPVPPPPQKSTLPRPADGVCPLCLKSRTNDTVLAVSGYVFCYPCVYHYVQKHGCCPVTSYPCKPEHLVKLYLPS